MLPVHMFTAVMKEVARQPLIHHRSSISSSLVSVTEGEKQCHHARVALSLSFVVNVLSSILCMQAWLVEYGGGRKPASSNLFCQTVGDRL